MKPFKASPKAKLEFWSFIFFKVLCYQLLELSMTIIPQEGKAPTFLLPSRRSLRCAWTNPLWLGWRLPKLNLKHLCSSTRSESITPWPRLISIYRTLRARSEVELYPLSWKRLVSPFSILDLASFQDVHP